MLIDGIYCMNTFNELSSNTAIASLNISFDFQYQETSPIRVLLKT